MPDHRHITSNATTELINQKNMIPRPGHQLHPGYQQQKDQHAHSANFTAHPTGEHQHPSVLVQLSSHVGAQNHCSSHLNKHHNSHQSSPEKRAPPPGVHPPRRLTSISTIGNYKKGPCIGQGSFGTVFMALNDDGSFMALKEVEVGSQDAEEVKKLVDEISLLRTLDHPNIVRYLGSRILQHGIIVIFTEWVAGGSIRTILDRFGPLNPTVVRRYVSEALDGLVYLHANNIAHRDIKGANILITDSGTVKLADFGTSIKVFATPGKEDKTQSSDAPGNSSAGAPGMAGSPLFMAPEMMTEPDKCDGRKSDIWSLGATALQMSTGSPPWKEQGFQNFMQLMLFVARSDSNPKIDPSIPPALRDFIGLTFRRDPNLRPSARQLVMHPFLGRVAPGTMLRPGSLPPVSSVPNKEHRDIGARADCDVVEDERRYIQIPVSESAREYNPKEALQETSDKNSFFADSSVELPPAHESAVSNFEENRTQSNPFARGGEMEQEEGESIALAIQLERRGLEDTLMD